MLAPVEENPIPYSLPIPSPRCLALTSSPPWLPPPTPATPPCSASPQEPRCPLIWSDTTTYPRQRSSWRRLSYPRVPVVCSPLSLCSYGSVTIEQSHMGAPLQRLPNPQWSHGNSQHARCGGALFFRGTREDEVQPLKVTCANVHDVPLFQTTAFPIKKKTNN